MNERYTCPSCKESKSFVQSYGEDCPCICEKCGYKGSAYQVDWNEWPTLEFGGKK